MLRKLCEWKGVEIIEAEACPDHIHMLVSIPPKMSGANFMGYLKGKSAMIFILSLYTVILCISRFISSVLNCSLSICLSIKYGLSVVNHEIMS